MRSEHRFGAARGEVVRMDQAEFDFVYCWWVFRGNARISTAAQQRFTTTPNRGSFRREILASPSDRRRKSPRNQPNGGSIFNRNPETCAEIGPPGAAIERLGFNGYRISESMMLPHHATSVVNAGAASANEMMQLIGQVGKAAYCATGYEREPEVLSAEQDGTVKPITLQVLM